MRNTLLSLLMMTAGILPAMADEQPRIVSRQGSFDDVRDDLVLAIEARGLKINHTNYISNMLERTGEAVGDTRRLYVRAEQLEFCKADLSREMMEADPANIVFCPYTISIYILPDNPGQVFLSYRRPVPVISSTATDKALKAVDDLLSGIVSDAAQGAF